MEGNVTMNFKLNSIYDSVRKR